MPSDRQIQRQSEERSVTITEVNMTASSAPLIIGKDQYGTTLSLSTDWMGPIINVPNVGETWIIKRRGGSNWYPVAKHTTTSDTSVLNPGDCYIEGDTIYLDGTKIILLNLPTLDPHVINQLWNSAGTLKISAG